MRPIPIILLVSLSLLGLGSGHVMHHKPPAPAPAAGGGSGQQTAPQTAAPANHHGGTHGQTQGNHAHHGGGAHFNYDKHGQDWKQQFGNNCGGLHQSPVDLPMIANRWHPENFLFVGFNESRMWNMTNNGHSVKVTPGGAKKMMVLKGGLDGVYYVDQFHFHWPSEHTYQGIHFPLEMHIVCHKSTFPNIKEALYSPDGLAVLGVLFEEQDSNVIESKGLEEIINQLNSVKQPGSSVPFMTTNTRLMDLLPSDYTAFDRYNGSLTTPPCSEAVIWTVFHKSKTIPRSSMESLRTKVRDSSNYVLGENYRRTQPLNHRNVLMNA